MSIDTNRLQGLRDELLEHREGLRATIEHHDLAGATMSDSIGELQSSSTDNHIADTASETYERELDEGLEEDAKSQLRDVEAALERMDNGSSGTCAACGKEIPLDRLEAVPWTTLCIDDARKLQG